MNTKVWYLPYFEGVFHTRRIETFSKCECTCCMYGSYYALTQTYTHLFFLAFLLWLSRSSLHSLFHDHPQAMYHPTIGSIRPSPSIRNHFYLCSLACSFLFDHCSSEHNIHCVLQIIIIKLFLSPRHLV